MTKPNPEQAEDLTQDDAKVEQTGNYLQPEDPEDQPTQDPNFLPEGTVSEVADQ